LPNSGNETGLQSLGSTQYFCS